MCVVEAINGTSVGVGNIGEVTDALLEHIRSTFTDFQPGTLWRQPDGTFADHPPAESMEALSADQPT